jgi:hypothetical protein
LLKDISLVLAVGLGPKINPWVCLRVQPRTRHLTKCWLSIHGLFFFYILPRDPQRRLRSNKLSNTTVSCDSVPDFVSSYPSMSRYPIQHHGEPSRDIIQRLLALSHQLRRFGSPKSCQSGLAFVWIS